MKPSCVVQPRSAEEVSIALKTLTTKVTLKSCNFAIRSAGHGAYTGASNIENDVTINLGYMSLVEYDAESKLATIGPGATWDDVFATLEPLGVMTAGGRSSSVGVGGLTTGGGISFFSTEHGFVCDNVVEFEVVLADGRVVTASKATNPDLFTVLKGGSSNFGIVTAFNFRTFEYKGMWGGLRIYPGKTSHAQFQALVDFANNNHEDPKGTVILTTLYQSKVGADLFMNAYDYAEPVPRPAAYNEFLAIPGVSLSILQRSETCRLLHKNSKVRWIIGRLGGVMIGITSNNDQRFLRNLNVR